MYSHMFFLGGDTVYIESEKGEKNFQYVCFLIIFFIFHELVVKITSDTKYHKIYIRGDKDNSMGRSECWGRRQETESVAVASQPRYVITYITGATRMFSFLSTGSLLFPEADLLIENLHNKTWYCFKQHIIARVITVGSFQILLWNFRYRGKL